MKTLICPHWNFPGFEGLDFWAVDINEFLAVFEFRKLGNSGLQDS